MVCFRLFRALVSPLGSNSKKRDADILTPNVIIDPKRSQTQHHDQGCGREDVTTVVMYPHFHYRVFNARTSDAVPHEQNFLVLFSRRSVAYRSIAGLYREF